MMKNKEVVVSLDATVDETKRATMLCKPRFYTMRFELGAV